jgi:hypothetical protein
VCPVRFCGEGNEPEVLGHSKLPLGVTEQAVIKALVEAFPGGLTKGILERKTGTDPHKVLSRMQSRDPDWAKVIVRPGKAGRGGYRLQGC